MKHEPASPFAFHSLFSMAATSNAISWLVGGSKGIIAEYHYRVFNFYISEQFIQIDVKVVAQTSFDELFRTVEIDDSIVDAAILLWNLPLYEPTKLDWVPSLSLGHTLMRQPQREVKGKNRVRLALITNKPSSTCKLILRV